MLTIKLFQEGEWWIAQCREHDVCSQGKTRWDALDSLGYLLDGEAALSDDRGHGLQRLPPCPEEIWNKIC